MKKYLMIGFAAVAFAACSNHDFETTTQADIDKAKYDQAFMSYIGGRPASNQDWGFGLSTRAFTRTNINVNGNEEKYYNAPALLLEEEVQIRDYVRQLTTTPHVAPTGLKNYFVTQVHDGEEYYTNADGGAGILGSSKMNHLQIAMESGGEINSDGSLSTTGHWMHINNFNRGDNTDWNGNTLVEDGGTFNFAYHGTEDSQYHDRWISVRGADVDAYYNSLGVYSGSKYAGYYYICFDFEATIGGPTRVSNIEYYDPVLGNWQNSSTIDIPGIYTKEEIESLTLDLDIAIPVTHWDVDNNVSVVDRWVYVNLSNPAQVRKATFSNVLDGNKFIPGNNKYDDWIVRLVEAQPKQQIIITDDYDLRIIAEDLSATQASDFDFNDVVIDVKFGSPAKIVLVAAGGQLPLKVGSTNGVGGVEVHEAMLGEDNAKNGNVYKMINTGYPAPKGINDVPLKEITNDINMTISNNLEANNLRIEVYKNGEWQLLTANVGEPACKLAVDPNFVILGERESIKDKYENFVEWATTNNLSYWWDLPNE